MPMWQGKSKATTFGYRIFVILIKYFGIRAAYCLLYFVVPYYYFFSRKSSKQILNFYRQRLQFGLIRCHVMLLRNYYRFGQTLIDKTVVMANIPSRFTFNFDGEEHLHEMAAQKKGGLLLSAHAGNWEAAGQLLKRLGTRINIVMYDGEDAQVKNYMDSVTGERTFKIIYVKNDMSHIYKISEALGAGEIVCMHADRFLTGNRTLTIKFMGKEAKFPEGPFLLALKLKVPVTYVYSFKESATRYHFYSTKIKYFYQAKGDSMQGILADFVEDLEKKINLYPEQWFNYYDFWAK